MRMLEIFKGFTPVFLMRDFHEFSWNMSYSISSSGEPEPEVSVSHDVVGNGQIHYAMPFDQSIGVYDHPPSFAWSTREQITKFHFTNLNERARVSLGLTNSFMFDQAKNIAAILYGGDLKSAATTIVKNFGAPIGNNDYVVMKTKYDFARDGDHRLKVYFSHNGDDLGLAFDLPAGVMPFYTPVVSFIDRGTVTVNITEQPKSEIMETRAFNYITASGVYALTWTVASLTPQLFRASRLYVTEATQRGRVIYVQLTYSPIMAIYVANAPLRTQWKYSGFIGGKRPSDTGKNDTTVMVRAILGPTGIMRFDYDRKEIQLLHAGAKQAVWNRVTQGPPKPFVGNPFQHPWNDLAQIQELRAVVVDRPSWLED